MPRKRTTEEFILKANEIHKGKYSYIFVDYITKNDKVIIVCPIHGEFKQEAHSHLRGYGCSKCVGRYAYDAAEFIYRANKCHNEKYNYERVEYKCNRDIIKIICPIHGEFEQMAYMHLQGRGCPECGNESKGWTHSKWQNTGNNSQKFDGFKVYVMEFKEEDGTPFFKIGKTFRDIKYRINQITPYKSHSILIIPGIAPFCSKLEVMMHRALKEYKYKPKNNFAGSTECFSHIPDDIHNTLKSFSNN